MDKNQLYQELTFKTSRSGGAGGQHVNKVYTKVEVIFDVNDSNQFSEEQKEIISTKLANRIDTEGKLHLTCDETRSQLKNKEIVIERLFDLLDAALKPVKMCKPTKPSKSAVRKRLLDKKKLSDKKALRRL